MHQVKYVPVGIPAVSALTVVKKKEGLAAALKLKSHHAGAASIFTEAVLLGEEIDSQQDWACPRGTIAERRKQVKITLRHQFLIFIIQSLIVKIRDESVNDSSRIKRRARPYLPPAQGASFFCVAPKPGSTTQKLARGGEAQTHGA